jgi:hypothetical protein
MLVPKLMKNVMAAFTCAATSIVKTLQEETSGPIFKLIGTITVITLVFISHALLHHLSSCNDLIMNMNTTKYFYLFNFVRSI